MRPSPPSPNRLLKRSRSDGKWILTAGLGGMGGAQPLAATMNEAVILDVEVRPERIDAEE
ncbi:MAG: hypothetical protein MPW15_26490 [Candidatus Manganitrophus sp.]|nr:hypothetical protein [Candidatus Manganitrophus sp.]